MKKISNKIPLLFIEYQKQLKNTISQMGVTQKYVYDSIGMGRTTWQRRIRESSFNAIELMKVCEVINNKRKK